MDKKVSVSYAGIGFWGLLAIVLIVLKLTGLAQISWWAVVGCAFAPIVIFIATLLLLLPIGLVYIVGVSVWQTYGRKPR